MRQQNNPIFHYPECMQRIQNQSGRSFVEMLGTLAIMGILSIGAIAGFNYAMNKHRANELLDEARKRAYTVMTQIQLDMPRSLGEYAKHSTFAGGTFDDKADIKVDNYNQFKIHIQSVLPEVCQKMKEVVSDTTPIRRIVCSTTQKGGGYFVFNSDLSASDMGQLCNPQTGLRCRTDQICSTSGEVAGSCIDKKKTWECLTNADCKNKPNTYCKVFIQSYTNSTVSGGECADLGGSSGDVYIEGLGTVEESTREMNWYSAKNWCMAKGKSLIDVRGTRLGCYNASGLINIRNNTTNPIYCCAQGTPNCGSDMTKQSPIMQRIRSNFEGTAWTNTDQSDAMRAIRLDQNNAEFPGSVSYHGSTYQSRHALCE